jgi:hypothetical protein
MKDCETYFPGKNIVIGRETRTRLILVSVKRMLKFPSYDFA